uniref:DNA methyltransferase n=1 Tax=Mycoplasmopsis bovis TaxID=28903 RepID=UPI003D2AD9F7
SLIKYLISIIPNKNARILDFYAGSGTTGHAVMELNKEDGGNRSYTLVTNNENNIATNVCYERLYRINNGISTNNESNFDWIKENKPYNSNFNVINI